MNKKRAFALLMGILMIVTSLPLVALPTFAAGNVCKIEGATDAALNTEYATFDAAMTAVYDATVGTDGAPTDCGTLTLLTDASTDNVKNMKNYGRISFGCTRSGGSGTGYGVPTYKKLTIDLNGCTLTGVDNNTDRALIYIDAGSELTIKDSGTGGKITKYMTNPYGGLFHVAGTLKIEGGTFTENSTEAEGGSVAYLNGSRAVLQVSGGTFVGSVNKVFSYSGATLANSSITGGTFDTSTLTADGALEAAMAAQGYELVQDGTKYVATLTAPPQEPDDPVCQITGAETDSINKKYESLGAAFDAINSTLPGTNCGTVTLLKNCAATRTAASTETHGTIMVGTFFATAPEDTANLGKSVTLDLNGYVLKGSDTDRGIFCVTVGTTLTVKDTRPSVVHKYDLVDGLYVWDETDTTGEYTFAGGAITGGTTTDLGSAIQVRGGTANVEGGNFLGNTSKWGTICIAYNAAAVMNISGGTFAGNKRTDTTRSETWRNLCYGGFNMNNASKSSVTGGRFDIDIYEDLKTIWFGAGKRYETVKNGEWYIVSEKSDVEITPETVIAFRGTQRSNNADGEYSLRFVAEILESKVSGGNTKAGFDVTVNGVTHRIPVTHYYDTLLANEGNGITTEIRPLYEGHVLIALVIENIDADTIDICAAPYYKENGVDNYRQLADATVSRIVDSKIQMVKLTNLSIEPITYYTKADGSPGTVDNHVYEYKFMSIGAEITKRAYFGRYTWLSDKSGFICGKENGDFYYYDVAEEKLVFLDESHTAQASLLVYVNPSNNKAYYTKRDANNYVELWCINPKDTNDREMLFSAANATMPIDPETGDEIVFDETKSYGDDVNNFKKISIGLEVTNDGMYTYYQYHHVSSSPEYACILGRINLQTKKLEYGYEIKLGDLAYDKSNHVNHVIINPVYEDYILFNSVSQSDGYSNNYKCLYMINFAEDTMVYYQPRKQYLYDSAIEAGKPERAGYEGIYHMIWSYDGEYIVTHGGQWYGYALYLERDLLDQYNRDAGSPVPVERPIAYDLCNHYMLDESLKLGVGDGQNMPDSSGFSVGLYRMFNVTDEYGEDDKEDTYYFGAGITPVRGYKDEVYQKDLFVIRKGIGQDMVNLGLTDKATKVSHPYHPHPEITADGTLCSWGDINRETGTLGIAWFEIPESIRDVAYGGTN